MCFLALDCGAWGTDALHISWEDLDSFVFVPVALIPQVTQDDHLQVQNHHDCTRIASPLWVQVPQVAILRTCPNMTLDVERDVKPQL